ncbi:unnamed protein product [Thelazia callipaeda]|uniref:Transposase n=1 Tax=Thelazia callipaeda TaxID=103827 RepID=A0A0N5D0K2_THECL|nr:unnamed protein product [Thelazia callipaeda]
MCQHTEGLQEVICPTLLGHCFTAEAYSHFFRDDQRDESLTLIFYPHPSLPTLLCTSSGRTGTRVMV